MLPSSSVATALGSEQVLGGLSVGQPESSSGSRASSLQPPINESRGSRTRSPSAPLAAGATNASIITPVASAKARLLPIRTLLIQSPCRPCLPCFRPASYQTTSGPVSLRWKLELEELIVKNSADRQRQQRTPRPFLDKKPPPSNGGGS